jgi:hypothetical protein
MDPRLGDGQVLAGRYRLGRLLGQGGMAQVLDGYDTRLARPVAVKLLLPQLAANVDMRRRFEQEARAAARINHPNVVAVYDTGEDRGRAYMIMERLPGRTLADRIREGRMPAGEVQRIGADVLAALGAAHSLGMVHRDIKPGNILFASDGRAKVADFGIAKSVEMAGGSDTALADLTRTGLVVGTPAYLPPERIAGSPATPRADIYALGVVLYEALTGHKPAGPGPRLEAVGVPPALVAVVRRAMATEPAERYPSVVDMASALAAVGTSGPAATGAAATLPYGPRTEVMSREAGPPEATRLAGAVGTERRGAVAPEPPPHDWRKVGAAVLAGLIAAGVVVAVLLTNFNGGGARNPPAPGSTTAPARTAPATSPATTVTPTTTVAPTTAASSTTTTSTTTPTTTTPTTTKPTTTKPGPGGGGPGGGGGGGPGHGGHGGPHGG